MIEEENFKLYTPFELENELIKAYVSLTLKSKSLKQNKGYAVVEEDKNIKQTQKHNSIPTGKIHIDTTFVKWHRTSNDQNEENRGKRNG